MGSERRLDSGSRINLRFSSDEKERVRYWAEREGVSESEFVREAIDLRIRHLNGDYDLPTIHIQRQNQLIDMVAALSADIDNLARILISHTDTMTGLMRGDNNYLVDDEKDDIE